MAGISTKGTYGLAAMYQLARHHGRGHLHIREIAELAKIPQNYLEQILAILRKEGLIQSIRGAGGGYLLARHPSDITVFSILSVLEGDFCAQSDDAQEVVLNLFWDRVKEQMRDVFSETLQELVEKGNAIGRQTMYFI